MLKQGKALRLVQTGEDVREGKSMKKSIADPVFWKSLFARKESVHKIRLASLGSYQTIILLI